jgi:hypothetical protein
MVFVAEHDAWSHHDMTAIELGLQPPGKVVFGLYSFNGVVQLWQKGNARVVLQPGTRVIYLVIYLP